jgi:hypothetical protein
VFRKAVGTSPMRRSRTGAGDERRSGKALFDALYGSMSGTVTVADGVDLTAPTGELWDAEA